MSDIAIRIYVIVMDAGIYMLLYYLIIIILSYKDIRQLIFYPTAAMGASFNRVNAYHLPP